MLTSQDVLLDAAAGLIDDDPVSADFAGQGRALFRRGLLCDCLAIPSVKQQVCRSLDGNFRDVRNFVFD